MQQVDSLTVSVVSLEKRAEATYAEYCRQKASEPAGRGSRLPL